MADITGGDEQNLLGHNTLDEAAKTFASAVDKLSSIYDSKIKPGVSSAQSMWSGKPATFSRQSKSGNAGDPTFSGFNQYGAGTTGPGEYASQYLGPTSPHRKYLGQTGPLSGNGPSRGFPSSTFAAPKLPNGGGPNVPTKPPGQVSPGSSNAGGAAKGAGLSATFGALAKYGNKQLQTQLPMDQYVYQGSLGMSGNLGQNQAALRRQAFGANNQNLNAIAENSTDAASMYSIAGQVAGTPLLNQTASGRNINQAMSTVGVLNPYMTGTQNANVQANIYAPGTSMALMTQGLATPRQLGSGQAQNLSSVTSQWMSQFYGGKTPTMKELNAGLGNGGKINLSLQAAGLSPDSVTAAGNLMRAQLQVQQHGGNWNDAQKLIDKARQGDTSAGEELQQKYGLDKSLVQSLKNKQAAKTGRDSDTSAAFNSALSQATDTLQKFSEALTKVMNDTGLTGAMGTGGAWASQISGSLGGFGGLTQGIGGLYGAYALSKGVGGLAGKIPGASKFLGGGATAAEAETMGTAAASRGALAGAGPAGIATMLAMPSIQHGQDTAINNAIKRQGATPEEVKDATTPRKGETASQAKKRLADLVNKHSDDGQAGGDNANSNANTGKTANKSQKAGSKGQRATGNASATEVVKTAEKYLGTPYHFGGNSPKTNFDCSGLTQWSFKESGMNIPRLAKDQQNVGKEVPKNQVRAGDLIFKGKPAKHVALMIDNKHLIEAPHTGAVVRKRDYTPGEWTDAKRLIGLVGDLKNNTKGRQDDSNSLNEHAGDAGSGDQGDAGTYGSSSELTSLQNKMTAGNSAYSGVAAYATGTKSAKDSFIAGERGAEIVQTGEDGKTTVWNAKQSAEMLNNSKPMHDMLMGAGLANARSSGSGNVVNLNFSDNAIVIKAVGDSQTVQATTSKQVRADISRENMYDDIASGKKN